MRRCHLPASRQSSVGQGDLGLPVSAFVMAALVKEYSFGTEWCVTINMKNYGGGFGTGWWVEGGRV